MEHNLSHVSHNVHKAPVPELDEHYNYPQAHITLPKEQSPFHNSEFRHQETHTHTPKGYVLGHGGHPHKHRQHHHHHHHHHHHVHKQHQQLNLPGHA
jgi:hypothetical protein